MDVINCTAQDIIFEYPDGTQVYFKQSGYVIILHEVTVDARRVNDMPCIAKNPIMAEGFPPDNEGKVLIVDRTILEWYRRIGTDRSILTPALHPDDGAVYEQGKLQKIKNWIRL